MATSQRDLASLLGKFLDKVRFRSKSDTACQITSNRYAYDGRQSCETSIVKERIGYYDSGGSLFMPAFGGAYFDIDKPPPKTLERSVRSLFSGRRAHVLHAHLAHHQDSFGVTGVAERAQVAPSTASDVLSQLDRFD
jgi:hypothetical protein